MPWGLIDKNNYFKFMKHTMTGIKKVTKKKLFDLATRLSMNQTDVLEGLLNGTIPLNELWINKRK